MSDAFRFVLFIAALGTIVLLLVLHAEPVGEPSQTWPSGDGDAVEVHP